MARSHADPTRLEAASPGERLAFEWLAAELPDSYSLWHEPCVDGRTPDLVLFGARVGLVVLEVKDWSRDSILAVQGDGRVRVRHSGGEENETHPFEQARAAAHVIANRLDKLAPCRQHGGAFDGKLAFPWNVGAVFPNLTRGDVAALGLDARCPANAILTGDEIGGALAWALRGDRLVKRLEDLCSAHFAWHNDGEKRAAVDRVLAPPTVVASSFAGRARERDDGRQFLLLPGAERFTSEQEQLARDLRPGNGVIQGVAGSGKSEVVASQARLLAEAHRGWRILVLCFNVSLAGWLRTRVFANGALQQHDVTVAHFHGWCRDQLDRAGVAFDSRAYEADDPERFVRITRDAFRDGRILRRWHAILVDEAQDFSPTMIETCQAALEPGNSKLLFALDNAQHIYGNVGAAGAAKPLTALLGTGSTRVLKENLRCSREINGFSRRFLFGDVAEGESIRVGDRRAYVPRSSERSGVPVHVERCGDVESEIEWAALWCQELLESGYCPDEIAVLYTRRALGVGRGGVGDAPPAADLIALAEHHFGHFGNPLFWLARDTRTKEDAALVHGKVHLSTVHSFKGLEARAVVLVGANAPVDEIERDARAKALWYVGMTRATDRLAVTWSNPDGFGSRLKGLAAD